MQFDFDVIQYLTQLDQAPAVIFLVMAATYLAGQFGLDGKPQRAFAIALGVLMGNGLQIASLGVPADFGGWFFLELYAGVLGVTAPLLYDMGKGVIEKQITRALFRKDDDQLVG